MNVPEIRSVIHIFESLECFVHCFGSIFDFFVHLHCFASDRSRIFSNTIEMKFIVFMIICVRLGSCSLGDFHDEKDEWVKIDEDLWKNLDYVESIESELITHFQMLFEFNMRHLSRYAPLCANDVKALYSNQSPYFIRNIIGLWINFLV